MDTKPSELLKRPASFKGLNDLNLLPKKPTTFVELFDFYHNYVKVLYSYVQTENSLPLETLFEINAALDHISRHWIYGDTEEQVVNQGYGHLKRSCLDVFKIVLKSTRSQFDEIRKLDTSAIDNGEFDRDMRVLFSKIKMQALEARRTEGDQKTDGPIKAFDLWQPVFLDCIAFEQKFYLNKHIDWSHKKFLGRLWRSKLLAALGGAIVYGLGKYLVTTFIG